MFKIVFNESKADIKTRKQIESLTKDIAILEEQIKDLTVECSRKDKRIVFLEKLIIGFGGKKDGKVNNG